MKDNIYAGLAAIFANVGVISALFKWQNTKTDKIEKKIDEKYLTEKEHTLLCENSTLRIEQSFEKHFTTLSNEVFKSIRSLEKTINGKDNA